MTHQAPHRESAPTDAKRYLSPALMVVPCQDLQLMRTDGERKAAVRKAFADVGLVVDAMDPLSLRVTTGSATAYAYARDDRKFYFVGAVAARLVESSLQRFTLSPA